MRISFIGITARAEKLRHWMPLVPAAADLGFRAFHDRRDARSDRLKVWFEKQCYKLLAQQKQLGLFALR